MKVAEAYYQDGVRLMKECWPKVLIYLGVFGMHFADSIFSKRIIGSIFPSEKIGKPAMSSCLVMKKFGTKT